MGAIKRNPPRARRRAPGGIYAISADATRIPHLLVANQAFRRLLHRLRLVLIPFVVTLTITAFLLGVRA